jgi:hypothetical protein
LHERSLDFALFELTFVNTEIWYGSQSAEIGLLSSGDVWIAGSCLDIRSEVSDAVDDVTGQKSVAHGRDVQPLVRGVSDGAVVEVEAVNVDVSAHVSRTGHDRDRLSAVSTLPPK